MQAFSECKNSNSPANSPPSPPPQTPIQAADRRELPIVPAASNTPPFELPDGWVVEVRPRRPNSHGISSDKYYYEPGTGRKFRSLLSIKRYLTGEEEVLTRKEQRKCLVPYQNSDSYTRVVYGGKLLRPDELEAARLRKLEDIIPTTLQPKFSSVLPDGWIVEEVARKCGFRSDRYFIEPGTHKRFRSVPEVERYLAREKHKPEFKALAFTKHAKAPRSRAPRRKKNCSVNKLRAAFFDLTNPPNKINWVFSGDGKDNWSPLVEECVLPDYVKEQWAETFLMGMNGWKHRIPQLTMGESNQASNA